LQKRFCGRLSYVVYSTVWKILHYHYIIFSHIVWGIIIITNSKIYNFHKIKYIVIKFRILILKPESISYRLGILINFYLWLKSVPRINYKWIHSTFRQLVVDRLRKSIKSSVRTYCYRRACDNSLIWFIIQSIFHLFPARYRQRDELQWIQ